MKIKRFTIFLLPILVTLISNYSLAYQLEPMPEFRDNDRILILAPHPDDEAIGAGGIIQEALKRKLPIKVAY